MLKRILFLEIFTLQNFEKFYAKSIFYIQFIYIYILAANPQRSGCLIGISSKKSDPKQESSVSVKTETTPKKVKKKFKNTFF